VTISEFREFRFLGRPAGKCCWSIGPPAVLSSSIRRVDWLFDCWNLGVFGNVIQVAV